MVDMLYIHTSKKGRPMQPPMRPRFDSLGRRLAIPEFLESVQAGFPSPAQDHVERTLDLNELCIVHPAATFFVRAQGESMIDGGIHPNDVLVIDRALEPRHGDVIVATVHGEFTVKRLELRPRLRLVPDNPAYTPIEPTDENGFEVFGVVTHAIHRFRP